MTRKKEAVTATCMIPAIIITRVPYLVAMAVQQRIFEMLAGMQMMACSRGEAINLTGDDSFYTGNDELEEELESAGLTSST